MVTPLISEMVQVPVTAELIWNLGISAVSAEVMVVTLACTFQVTPSGDVSQKNVGVPDEECRIRTQGLAAMWASVITEPTLVAPWRATQPVVPRKNRHCTPPALRSSTEGAEEPVGLVGI